MQAGKVDMDDLLLKFQKEPDMLKKQTGFKDYIFNLESLYNKGKQLRLTIY